jgi:ribosomal protection tetracycline resistance protein
MKKTVIGIIAHVDSGKTTLSEAMLYLSGKIRKVGRVDHGDAFLDTDMIEKNRGITVFSKPAEFEYKNTSFTLLDTLVMSISQRKLSVHYRCLILLCLL